MIWELWQAFGLAWARKGFWGIVLTMKMEGVGALRLGGLGLRMIPSVVLITDLRDVDRNGFDGTAANRLGSVWAIGVAGQMTDFCLFLKLIA